MQQARTNLCKLISGFLRNMHDEAGNSIKHVTIVVHGQPEYFDESRYADHLSFPAKDGLRQVSYQSIQLEAPVDNLVTMVTSNRQHTKR